MSERLDPQKLIRRTLGLANSVHEFVEKANLAGGDEIAAEARRWEHDATTVVVAGEVKRGKSSLVNALVGSELLPVDVDVATAVPIALSRSDDPRITVTRFRDGETRTENIDESSFATAATGQAPFEDAISITLEAPVVPPGIVLVDTPGVGGLSPGHRDLTMSTIGSADALIVVLSAVEPPTRAELDFLAEATDRIDRIMLVASRSDLHPSDRNDQLVEELRAHLHRWADTAPPDGDAELHQARAVRLGHLADRPIVLTSAHLARQARRRAERGQDDRAAELRTRSGVGNLARQIGEWGQRRAQIRHANLVRLIDSVLAGADDQLRRQLRASEGDLSVADELRETLTRLEAVSGEQARWRSQLGVAIQRLQTEAGRTITRHLNGLRTRYTEVIEERAADPGTDLVAELERSVQAAWIDLVDQLNGDFAREVEDLASSVDMDDLGIVLGGLDSPASLALSQRSADEDGSALEHTLPVLGQSFMFGNLVNVGAGLAGVATGGLGLVAYGIGAAVAMPLNRLRRERQQQRRAAVDLERSLNEALFGHEGVARELNAALGLRLIEARVELERTIEARLADRRRSVETQKKELEEAAKREARDRQRLRAEVSASLGQVADLRKQRQELAG